MNSIDEWKFHTPVLVEEVEQFLKIKDCRLIFDCTCGTGGHSLNFLEKTPSDCFVVGIDWDEESLKISTERLKRFGNRFIPQKRNFSELGEIVKEVNRGLPDAILLDLGLSSYQLLYSNRGFSFQKDAPLDMRMDKSQNLTASNVLNSYSEESLEKIFREFGEERRARFYATKIAEFRKKKKILTVVDLFEAFKLPPPEKFHSTGKIHPLTRIFQALRIAVNDELSNLSSFLSGFTDFLNGDGRLAVISYHSLEDRLVKNAFKEKLREGKIKIVTKKCIRPGAEEIKRNRRSRSAKLRVCHKI